MQKQEAPFGHHKEKYQRCKVMVLFANINRCTTNLIIKVSPTVSFVMTHLVRDNGNTMTLNRHNMRAKQIRKPF